MRQEMKDNLEIRWKITDAFAKGVASDADRFIWQFICEKSHFDTIFNVYTNVDKTYKGILENVQFFVENCSPQGLLDYIKFYETERGIAWAEVYLSNVNIYTSTEIDYAENTNWWKDHLQLFE